MNLVEAQCYTAFIDILGISDLIERNLAVGRDKLSLFHDHVRSFVSSKPAGLKQSIVFSDSLILIWDNINDAINGCADFFANVYDSNGQIFQQYYGDKYKYQALLLRGAISEGTIELEDEEVVNASAQRFIIGSGLSRSAKGESLVKGSRLLLLGNWSDLQSSIVDTTLLSPKSKICREVLWPLKKNLSFNQFDRLKWIIYLNELYRNDPIYISKHFRDTLWTILRSVIRQRPSERELCEIIALIEQKRVINPEESFWLPVTLALAQIIYETPNLEIDPNFKGKIMETVFGNSSLALMESI